MKVGGTFPSCRRGTIKDSVPRNHRRHCPAKPQGGGIRKPKASRAKPWVARAMTRQAPTGRDSSVPDIAFVELDLVARQQQPQFILVRDLAVVLFLTGDIRFDVSR